MYCNMVLYIYMIQLLYSAVLLHSVSIGNMFKCAVMGFIGLARQKHVRDMFIEEDMDY